MDTVYSRKGSMFYILTKVYLNCNFPKLKEKCDVSVQCVATDPDVISEHAQHFYRCTVHFEDSLFITYQQMH
jgi:hypothetical protein